MQLIRAADLGRIFWDFVNLDVIREDRKLEMTTKFSPIVSPPSDKSTEAKLFKPEVENLLDEREALIEAGEFVEGMDQFRLPERQVMRAKAVAVNSR
jgi:hypothetical protein